MIRQPVKKHDGERCTRTVIEQLRTRVGRDAIVIASHNLPCAHDRFFMRLRGSALRRLDQRQAHTAR